MWWAVVLFAGVLLVAAACGQQVGQAEVTVAPPIADVPIGPLPGQADAGRAPPLPTPPFADNVDALAEGRRFFLQYNCAGCHGEHGGGGMGPSLRDDVWLYGSTPAHVANSIAEGRAYGMPAWGMMLTEVQIWQMTAYIKSMRTEREPDPPAGP